MKKTIFLLFGLALSVIIYSQNYYPLIEDDKTWNVLNVNLVSIGPPVDTTFNTQSFKLFGDTILNSVTYKKLYSSNEEIPVNWNLWGFMREDTNKKVWAKRVLDEEEVLMYDFSVNEGDSLLIGYIEPIYHYVDSVTIVTINGTSRKKYWLSMSNYYWETWIEGIGSNKGIVGSGSGNMVGGWTWLLCMSENNELIYMNPYYNSCYMISTDITDNNKAIFQVYPNPINNDFRIEYPANIKIKSLSILNLTGQTIKQFDPVTAQLDISGITSGMYFLKISCENEVITKKILISN